MATPLRSASKRMSFLSWILLLFITEVLLETGIQLKSLIVTGLSVKNVLIVGLSLYVFFKSNGTLRWASAIGLRKTILVYLLLTGYAALSLTFPFLLGIEPYNIAIAATSFKNEMLDSMLCMIIFAYFASRPGQGMPLLQGVLIIIGVSALLTFFDSTIAAGKIFGYSEATFRTKGAMGEPNQTASVYAMYAPIAMALILAGHRTLLNISLLGFILVAILVTGSRGGMVACTTSLLFTLWSCRAYIPLGKKLIIIISIPIVSILLWAILPEYYKELILARFFVDAKSPVSMRELSAGRTLIWEYAIDYWLRSPVIGSGWFGFAATANFATHNTYVEYIVSIGIVGMAIFTYLWTTVYTRIKRIGRGIVLPKELKILTQGALGAVIGILTAIFFVNLYKPWLFVWVGVGICLGYLSERSFTYRKQAALEKQQYDGR